MLEEIPLSVTQWRKNLSGHASSALLRNSLSGLYGWVWRFYMAVIQKLGQTFIHICSLKKGFYRALLVWRKNCTKSHSSGSVFLSAHRIWTFRWISACLLQTVYSMLRGKFLASVPSSSLALSLPPPSAVRRVSPTYLHQTVFVVFRGLFDAWDYR